MHWRREQLIHGIAFGGENPGSSFDSVDPVWLCWTNHSTTSNIIVLLCKVENENNKLFPKVIMRIQHNDVTVIKNMNESSMKSEILIVMFHAEFQNKAQCLANSKHSIYAVWMDEWIIVPQHTTDATNAQYMHSDQRVNAWMIYISVLIVLGTQQMFDACILNE